MALLKFENVGLRAISATVPHRVVKTREMTEYYSEEEIENDPRLKALLTR